MVLTKRCSEQPMKCLEDTCSSAHEPRHFYQWLTELDFHSHHCATLKKYLYTKTLEERIYKHATSSCTPKDMFCQVETYTAIWDKSLIHSCPYVKVKTASMNRYDNTIVGEGILLQLKNNTTECGVNLTSTEEGVYVSLDHEAENLEKSPIDLNTQTHLILADVDFKVYQLYQDLNKKSGDLSKQNCEVLQTFLKSKIKDHNKIIAIKDHYGTEMVLINQEGSMIITNCTKINSIRIINQTKPCHREIVVMFDHNKKGFLKDFGIITDTIDGNTCKQTNIVNLDDNQKIILNNNTIRIINITNGHSIANMSNKNIIWNVTHISELRDNNDFLEQMVIMENHKKLDNEIIRENENFNDNRDSDVINQGNYFANRFRKLLYINFSVLTLFLIISLIIVIWLKLKRHYSNKKEEQHRRIYRKRKLLMTDWKEPKKFRTQFHNDSGIEETQL